MTKLLLFVVGIMVMSLIGVQSANAQTDEFSAGYTTGVQQGGIDKHANIFHIGSICLGQTANWCNGFLSGYLDGFFSTLPTSTHTTTIIRESHRGERSGCHDNMTNCKPSPTPTPTPKPTPTPPPTPPPCKKVNGTCV